MPAIDRTQAGQEVDAGGQALVTSAVAMRSAPSAPDSAEADQALTGIVKWLP
ncbi:hypothetical protein AB6G66_27035 [Klebsiella pneumoniae]|uniref:hypothetical protein n=1 Tax=Klebsiella pneumoniae TaxID=573 RepID=UPI0034DCE6D9